MKIYNTAYFFFNVLFSLMLTFSMFQQSALPARPLQSWTKSLELLTKQWYNWLLLIKKAQKDFSKSMITEQFVVFFWSRQKEIILIWFLSLDINRSWLTMKNSLKSQDKLLQIFYNWLTPVIFFLDFSVIRKLTFEVFYFNISHEQR